MLAGMLVRLTLVRSNFDYLLADFWIYRVLINKREPGERILGITKQLEKIANFEGASKK